MRWSYAIVVALCVCALGCDEVAVELTLREHAIAPFKSHVALPRPGRPFQL